MSEASPRFRQDLSVSPTEADGVACVDVSDPKTGANFRLYDFEYQLALQLNGQPVAQVTDWASKTYGADLTADGIAEFASRLGELGFLEMRPLGGSPAPPARGSVEQSSPIPTRLPATSDWSGPRAPLPTTAIRARNELASSPPAAPVEPAPAGEDASDAAEAEWHSAQAAKTAQFVPDSAMLDSAPEPTPVVPLDLLKLAGSPAAPAPASVPEGAPTAIHGEVTAQAIMELPSEALDSEPVSAPPVTLAPKADVAAKASWATDLDGALQSSDSPPAVLPPPVAKSEAVVPELPVQVAPPPPGLPERRQPPEPEAVVMSAFSDGAARAKSKPPRAKRPTLVIVLVLLAAAAGIGYWVWCHQRPAAAPQALHVRVMSPAPTAVYRWFSGRGQVTDYETTTLAFANPGRLAELLPAGTEIAAGDVVAKLQGASGLETLLAHDRSRVGFYKQLRDSMRAAGNNAELRQAELHLVEKEKLVDMALAGLTKFTVAAKEPGEVVETLAKIGTPIAAGAPVARVKGRLLHGAFELDREERATLAKMDFCRVEVVGLGPRASNDLPRNGGSTTAADMGAPEAQVGPRFLDCKLPRGATTASGPKVEIPLPGELGLVSGQPLRLARRRFDAVFPVPAAAVVGDGDRRSVWIAGNDGTAELRQVAVVDASEDTLVSDGLRVGDQVIVDPPAGLRPGTRIAPAR
jgi:membrane fusion protein, multidrug efflux system